MRVTDFGAYFFRMGEEQRHNEAAPSAPTQLAGGPGPGPTSHAAANPDSPPRGRMIQVDLDCPPGAPRKPRRYASSSGDMGTTKRALSFDDD